MSAAAVQVAKTCKVIVQSKGCIAAIPQGFKYTRSLPDELIAVWRKLCAEAAVAKPDKVLVQDQPDDSFLALMTVSNSDG